MEFRILGPLEVVDGGRRIVVGAAKEQALLAVLLLHAGEVVSRERLIDALWGESPPPRAAKAVNVRVSQLRKALAVNGSDPIATRSGGYALHIDPAALDATTFEGLVADARARMATGEIEAAGALLRDAVSLWRGPALSGLALEADARSEVERLEELRLGALLDRIDCDLALGRHESVVSELAALVGKHPLRERLRAQYMLALYRSGRQADALDAYQDARRTLVDELGLEPSPALLRLQKAILNHDRALDAPAGIGQPPVEDRRQEREARRRPRALRMVLVALLVVVAGAAYAAQRSPHVAVAPNSVVVIDTTRNEIAADIPVGVAPGPIAASRGSIWVANTEDRTVSRIDPSSRSVVRTVPLQATPTGIAAGAGGVWVAHGFLGTVSRISPRYDRVTATIRVASKPRRYASIDGVVAAAGGAVWAGFGDSTVARIDPATNAVVARTYARAPPAAIGVGESAVWVAERDGTLGRIDPRTAAFVAAPISVVPSPSGIAVSNLAEWISSRSSDRVAWVVGDSARTISTGRGADGVAYANGAVWIANGGDASVARLNAETGKVEATIPLHERPVGVAVADGKVWVTVQRR